MTTVPILDFNHLLALTGPFGTFEHARHSTARIEHGYCTDDVARVLLVTAREPVLAEELGNLAASSIEFLAQAQGSSGEFKNRRSPDGSWTGQPSNEDCWGRAVWALGTVVASSSAVSLHGQAHRLLERAALVRSPWPRSMAWAAMGAIEVLRSEPADRNAHQLLLAAVDVLDRTEMSDDWRWPEPRLTYANAALAEALVAAGTWLGDDRIQQMGLRQLRWLLTVETRDGHLSVSPVGGRGPLDPPRQYDQQPIEVAAMADACVRAYDATGDEEWLVGVERAVGWFIGENDAGAVMFDPSSGGGFDGLTATGPNLNQGAESTVALLTTLQYARRYALSAS